MMRLAGLRYGLLLTVAAIPALADDLPAPGTAADAPIQASQTPPPVAQQTSQPASTVAAPGAETTFALAPELRERLAQEKSALTIREDREALAKFYEARNGQPLWVGPKGLTRGADALITEIGKAGDYGLDASAFKTPDSVGLEATISQLADAEVTLSLAALKYARFARGGRMDPQALNVSIDRKAQLLPPAQVLAQLAASETPDATLRGFEPQNPQFEKLRQKWLAVRAGQTVLEEPAAPAEAADALKSKKKPGRSEDARKPLSAEALERKLLVNMEMWRWIPTLGNYYIQPNIPEFAVRVVKDGKPIHTERIVTGQPSKKTPMFSDEMRLVVFKPFWNVPESIKYNEMLPQLMRGASLEKSGYRAEINGRRIEPGSVDWVDVDMRQVHIFQPPGSGNALGRVKFLFPNKHDVYLHDTPSKDLFNASSRAFSHGCVRVREPLKLAEIILSNDKGWTRAQVDQAANNGPENNEVKLDKPIPIHITYFTATVDEDGKLHVFDDVYGHEKRVQMGLEGKVSQIPQEGPEASYKGPSPEDRRRFAEQRQQKNDPVGNFFKQLFN